MERMTRRFMLTALACLVGTAAPLKAEDAKEAKEAKEEVSSLWPIEAMMKQAAENISRRYNLNEEQRQFTHKLLTEEVTKFLETHDDVWPLIRDLARFQMKGENPEGDVAKRIGERAEPILQEVKEAILGANQQWREILTPEQRQMHDWDLRDMERTFAKMDANFEAMRAGVPGKAEVFPSPNTEEPQPKRPPKPDPNFKPTPPSPAQESHQEEWWDRYVQEFIRRYDLDESQAESALSVLRECKERARTYRKTKEKEYEQVRTRLDDANKTRDVQVKKAKIRVWTQIRKSLDKPIVDLFQELKDRLERIPTEAQKERANPHRAQIRRTAQQPPAKPDAVKEPAPAGENPDAAAPAESPASPAPSENEKPAHASTGEASDESAPSPAPSPPPAP